MAISSLSSLSPFPQGPLISQAVLNHKIPPGPYSPAWPYGCFANLLAPILEDPTLPLAIDTLPQFAHLKPASVQSISTAAWVNYLWIFHGIYHADENLICQRLSPHTPEALLIVSHEDNLLTRAVKKGMCRLASSLLELTPPNTDLYQTLYYLIMCQYAHLSEPAWDQLACKLIEKSTPDALYKNHQPADCLALAIAYKKEKLVQKIALRMPLKELELRGEKYSQARHYSSWLTPVLPEAIRILKETAQTKKAVSTFLLGCCHSQPADSSVARFVHNRLHDLHLERLIVEFLTPANKVR